MSRPRALRRSLGLALLGGLLLAPAFVPDYHLIFIAELACWGLFAVAFDLVFGYAGMLSFCQALFFGAGAYGVAYAIYFWKAEVWVALALGLAVAVVAALAVGFVAIRVSGHHFLISTIIISVLMYLILESGQWRWITGGYSGRPFPTPEVPLVFTRVSMQSETVAYYFVMALALLAFAGCARVVRSPLGRAVACIRENELRARMVGFHVERAKLAIFAIAGGVAGLSGGLYSLLFRYTNLSFFEWTLSGKAVVWTVVGGAGTLVGPVLGSAVYIVLSEFLSGYFRSFPIVFGVVLIVTVIAAPRGLMGWLGSRGIR
jgi:branched-chain amino acid transport system permease protein